MPNYIELYKDKAGKWRWRRKAANGQITASSGESFSDLDAAHKAASREAEGTDAEVVTEK